MKKILLAACGVICLSLTTVPVQAGAVWDGSEGDNLWNNALNWSASPVNATCIFSSATTTPNIFFNADSTAARVRQNVSSPVRTLAIDSAALADATLTISGSTETIDMAAATANFVWDGTANGNGARLKMAIGSTLPMVINTGTSLILNLDVSGAGGVNKTGLGTLILGGVNTYLNTTVVSAGTLLVNGSTVAASVVTASGGTLGGTGTIGGNTSIGAATLAPGQSAGTLTFSSDLALASTTTLAFELEGANTTVGGGINDLGIVGGTLTLDGTLNVSELTLGSFLSANAGDQWRLFDYTTGLTDNGLTLGLTPTLSGGLGFEIDTGTFGQVNLVVTVVPEPATLALALCGGLGMWAASRRRRSA